MSEKAQLEKQLEKERQAFDRLREGHEKKCKSQEQEIQGLRAEIGVLQSAYDDLKHQFASQETELDDLHRQTETIPVLEEAVQRLKRQDVEQKKLLAQLRDADATANQVQDELFESHAEVDELKKDRDGLQRHCSELEGKLKLANAHVENQGQELSSLREELASTKLFQDQLAVCHADIDRMRSENERAQAETERADRAELALNEASKSESLLKDDVLASTRALEQLLKDMLEKSLKQNENLTAELSSVREQHADAKARLELAQEKMEFREREYAFSMGLHTELKEAKMHESELRTQIHRMTMLQDEMRQKMDTQNQELNENGQMIQTLKLEKDRLAFEGETTTAKNSELSAQLEALRAKDSSVADSVQIRQLQGEMQKLRLDTARKQEEIDNANARAEVAEKQAREASDRAHGADRLHAELSEFKDMNEKLRYEKTEAYAKIESLQKSVAEMRKSMLAAEDSANRSASLRILQQQETIDSLKKQLEAEFRRAERKLEEADMMQRALEDFKGKERKAAFTINQLKEDISRNASLRTSTKTAAGDENYIQQLEDQVAMLQTVMKKNRVDMELEHENQIKELTREKLALERKLHIQKDSSFKDTSVDLEAPSAATGRTLPTWMTSSRKYHGY